MNMKRAIAQQTGSIILEALIAILIFSIGILALIGMQATAINTVSDSKYRSAAGFLANQIIGTVWATRPNSINGSNVVISAPNPTFACTPCTAANGNVWTQAWVASGVSQLPAGTASIAITNSPSVNPVTSMVTVTLTWQPPKHDSTAGVVTHRHIVSAFIN
jgi:type IV pilus assembly protein PilV